LLTLYIVGLLATTFGMGNERSEGGEGERQSNKKLREDYTCTPHTLVLYFS